MELTPTDAAMVLQAAATIQTATPYNRYSADWQALLNSMQTRLSDAQASQHTIFSTAQKDADDLHTGIRPNSTTEPEKGVFGAYLGACVDDTDRQYHNCTCCKKFLFRFGDLVTISADYKKESVLWHPEDLDATNYYLPHVQAMKDYVEKAKIVQPWLSTQQQLGDPFKGGWEHFSLTNTQITTHYDKIELPEGEVLTEERLEGSLRNRQQLHTLLLNSVLQFDENVTAQVAALITAKAFFNPEKIEHFLNLLIRIQKARKANPKSLADIIWHFVEDEAPGFVTFGSGVLGQLLDGVKSGNTQAAINNCNSQTDPKRYQQQTKEANEQQILRAEQAFARLNAADSLKWRDAMLSEIPRFIWQPTAPVVSDMKSGGLFDKLKTKENVPAEAIALTGVHAISWSVFLRDVVPHAQAMEAILQGFGIRYIGNIRMAVDEAPPLLQWDTPEQRNRFAGYMYVEPINPVAVNLPLRGSIPVTAILFNPRQYYTNDPHDMQWAPTIVLKDCRPVQGDTLNKTPLFAASFRSEFHDHKTVILNYVNTTPMVHYDGDANGISPIGAVLRVTANGVIKTYQIDRVE